MLLSRVADALYWIGRYLERAEHATRVIDVRLDLGLDRRAEGTGWDFGRLYESLQYDPPDDMPFSPAALIDTTIFDPANRQSILAWVTVARENARQVREEISSEMWEQINGLYLRLEDVRIEGTWPSRPHYLARFIIEGIHLFQGITDATMGHGEGWQYLRVGRFLERADATAALLDLYYRNPEHTNAAVINHGEWAGLLRSCASLEAYCRVYTAELRPDRIAEFLLLNPVGPRSIRFAAAEVESSLQTIGEHVSRRSAERAERLAGRLHASLDYGQVDEILADNPHVYLEGISRQCAQIHAAFHQSYIAYAIESAIPA
jgi:uncharacterized alpha-E superfamily protein